MKIIEALKGRSLFGGSTWTKLHKLLAFDANGGDEFGYDVAVDGNRVLIGVRLDDQPTNAGSAYVFELPATAPVPSVSWVGLGALALLLFSAGARALRR